MKPIALVIALLLCATSFAQSKTKKTAPAVSKPAGIPASTTDSVSYAMALTTAGYFKDKGVTRVNMAMVERAFNDVFSGRKTAMTPEEGNAVITSCLKKLDSDKTSVAKKAGAAYLAANANKPGVVVLPSGLQYMIIKAGTGARPVLTDKVKVHYHGTLTDGTVFDSSVDRGEPIVLPVNRVIPGWTEALQLMPVGSKWKLFIPSSLAYGDQDAGPVIKGGSTLVFDVELIDIEPKDGKDTPAQK